MESVDKLREWSKRYDNHWIDPKTGEMTAIYGECRPSERFSVNEGERMRELLDEIEREHKREVNEAQSSAVFMPNHRISMPLDAEDMPIDLGDEVVFASGESEDHFTVDAFWLDRDGWHVNGEFDAMPSELRHWEAPAVDALLMQFVVDAADTASVTEMGALVDEYADRIREAVEHEEDE